MKKCLPNKVNRARLGEKCYDIECVDGGIKNNYKNIDGTDESGVVRCCKGSYTNILNSSNVLKINVLLQLLVKLVNTKIVWVMIQMIK